MHVYTFPGTWIVVVLAPVAMILHMLILFYLSSHVVVIFSVANCPCQRNNTVFDYSRANVQNKHKPLNAKPNTKQYSENTGGFLFDHFFISSPFSPVQVRMPLIPLLATKV